MNSFYNFLFRSGYTILISMFLVFTFKVKTSAQTTPQVEIDALMAIYAATGGSSWTNSTNWGVGDPNTNNWYGVGFNYDGSVRTLRLRQNNLSGTIPSDVRDLKNLAYLDLPLNNLEGNIPVEICNLNSLYFIDLSSNKLTGNIPSGIGNLGKLKYFYLENNRLSGVIPDDLSGLISLTHLSFANNQLTGNIPGGIGDLPILYDLNLYSNRFNGRIPSEIGRCTNLYKLNLGGNNLEGSIPKEIGYLTKLQELDLTYNNITGSIPSEIGNLTALRALRLFNNDISGSIPPEIGKLINLTGLYLYNNDISGSIPSEIGKLTKLRVLYLWYNNITEIPSEIGNLRDLLKLSLKGNNLTAIPPGIVNLSALDYLDLSNNQIVGSIPPEIGNMPRLFSLFLNNNQLTGSVPPELGNVFKRSLNLSNNNLSGCFDSNLHSLCGNFVYIYFSGNPDLPDFNAFCEDGTGECPPCAINSVTVGAQTACTSIDNTYSQELSITFDYSLGDGYLMVNDQQFEIGTSPQNITLVDLVADGNPVNVSVYFSSLPDCLYNEDALFSAPSACHPPVAECKDVTVIAGFNCNAEASVDNGSFDQDNDPLIITQEPQEPYSLGETIITLTVSDGSSSSKCTATVTVIDNTAPIPDVTILPDANGECSVAIEFPPTATDNCSGPVTGTTTYPILYEEQGTYTVTWTFTDAYGNSSYQLQQVNVDDITPPVINTFPNPAVTLTLGNHGYVTVTIPELVSSVTDNCAILSVDDISIIKVESDEEEDADESQDMNDGRTSDDMVISDDCSSVELLDESNIKGNGRVYTIYMSVDDGNGNTTVSAAEVHAIKGGDLAIKDETQYTVTSKFCGVQELAQPDLKSGKIQINSDGELSLKNYPNPFNTNTIIEYNIPKKGHVLIELFNPTGQKLSILTNETRQSGMNQKDFNASDLSGGIYFYRLTYNNQQITKRMIIRK